MAPWGYKLTLHIYVEGGHPGDAIFDAARDAGNALEARGHVLDFIGASLKEVKDKPVGQGNY